MGELLDWIDFKNVNVVDSIPPKYLNDSTSSNNDEKDKETYPVDGVDQQGLVCCFH